MFTLGFYGVVLCIHSSFAFRFVVECNLDRRQTKTHPRNGRQPALIKKRECVAMHKLCSRFHGCVSWFVVYCLCLMLSWIGL